MNAVAPRDCRSFQFLEQRPAWAALEKLLRSVREIDGSLDEPFIFLHGPSGGGKSHLMDRLADCVEPPLTVVKVAAEANFRSVRSTRKHDATFFPGEAPDLLIVEDLQFLHPSAFEPFLQMLDDRRCRDLATAITASAGPRHLQIQGKPFPQRLTSRLTSGLVVAVPLPGVESRRTALESLLDAASLTIPETVVDFLANRRRTIRELEGAVSQLEAYGRVHQGRFDSDALLEYFREPSSGEDGSVERIIQRVAKWFRVAPRDIRSRSRRRSVVVPRHVSMYLARRLTALSFQEIASHFGTRDHATVIHACRKMEASIDDDPTLGGTIRQLQDDLAFSPVRVANGL